MLSNIHVNITLQENVVGILIFRLLGTEREIEIFYS
jgi:hypothetical protein